MRYVRSCGERKAETVPDAADVQLLRAKQQKSTVVWSVGRDGSGINPAI